MTLLHLVASSLAPLMHLRALTGPFTDHKKSNLVFIIEIRVMKKNGFLIILIFTIQLLEVRSPTNRARNGWGAYLDPTPKGPRIHLGKVQSGPAGGQ